MRDVLVTQSESSVAASLITGSDRTGLAATTAHFPVDPIDPVDPSSIASGSESLLAVTSMLRAALMECAPPAATRRIFAHPCFALACGEAHKDLSAFVAKDPAQHGSWHVTLTGSTSYKAILHYRLASALISMANADPHDTDGFESYALLVSNRGKLLSGAEIHPRCTIGKRFVLDHGWGTVIGETSVVGDDCYLLGGVTLGAAGIAGNASVQRHPTLGNRVQVGAFARVFGNVLIGDDVFIGTHCCITQPIPANSVVTLRSENQVVRAATAGCRA